MFTFYPENFQHMGPQHCNYFAFANSGICVHMQLARNEKWGVNMTAVLFSLCFLHCLHSQV